MKILSLAFILLGLMACAQAMSIYEVLQTQGDMTTLVSLIDGQPAVKARLENESVKTTLFAPTNGAITSAVNGGFDAGDSDLVLNTLLYHAVNGEVMSGDLKDAQAVETLSANSEYVQLNGDGQVLVITVGNDATVRVSYGIGSGVVVEADIEADNGVIHKVNALLQLPSNVVTTGTAAGLSTLLEAVVSADLAATLLDAEGITVFAPTNQAFEDLGVDLGTLSQAELREILLYHVVGSPIYSPNLDSKQKVESLQGDYLTVRVASDGSVTVDDEAEVVVADALISNGNVHVINKVLMPSGDTGAASSTTVALFGVFVATLIALFI